MALIPFILLAAALKWLNKPLPPPEVSLNLVGFTAVGTNTFAVMSLSNHGPTSLYFDEREWSALFQGEDSAVTNYGTGWETLWNVQKSSNVTFNVEIPRGISRFQVMAIYSYFNHHHVRLEMKEWLGGTGRKQSLLGRAFENLDPLLSRLPEPLVVMEKTDTGWLTNLPPERVAE